MNLSTLLLFGSTLIDEYTFFAIRGYAINEIVTGMRIAGTEVLAAGEEPAAYGATIRDGGAGSTKVWAGRCIR